MRVLKLRFGDKQYSDETINKSLSSILESNTLLSMATLKNNKESYVNTVYFAYSDHLNFYYLSPPSAVHSKNLVKNKSVAVSIFDSHQNLPTAKKSGLQIFGEARLARGNELFEGLQLYSRRYIWIVKYIKKPQDLLKKIIQSKLYIIKPAKIKIFDEATFGDEVWVTVSIPS